MIPTQIPNPGSKEAIDLGCLCAVVDNHYGKGYWPGVKDENGEQLFCITQGCPLHDKSGLTK